MSLKLCCFWIKTIQWGPLCRRDPGQRERKKDRERRRERNETEGLRRWEKRGQEERQAETKGEGRKRGGNYLAYRGSWQVGKFRGGICDGDSEILSPIKRDFRRTLRCGVDKKPPRCSHASKIHLDNQLEWKEEKCVSRSYCGSAANKVSETWLLAKLLCYSCQKGPPQEVDFKAQLKMINCCGMNRCWNTLEWCQGGWGSPAYLMYSWSCRNIINDINYLLIYKDSTIIILMFYTLINKYVLQFRKKQLPLF